MVYKVQQIMTPWTFKAEKEVVETYIYQKAILPLLLLQRLKQKKHKGKIRRPKDIISIHIIMGNNNTKDLIPIYKAGTQKVAPWVLPEKKTCGQST